MISMSARGSAPMNVYLKAISPTIGGRAVTAILGSSDLSISSSVQRDEMMPEVVPYQWQWTAYPLEPLLPKDSPPKATSYSLSTSLLRRRLTTGSGINQPLIRFIHSDLRIPDFTQYRRDSTKDPNKLNNQSVDNRRVFTYVMTAGVGVTAAITSKAVVQSCLSILSPAKDVLALAKIEVELSGIPEGKNLTVKWRGKPVFVRRRTAEEIARERSVDLNQLRDPEADERRTDPSGQWLVLIGVCTHLGCVPIPGQGDFGGYYCPCHGSHYDASGRIRKGPAPLNLEIPEHEITGSTLVVG